MVAADDKQSVELLLGWTDFILDGCKDVEAILLNKHDPHSNDSDKKELLI